MKDYYLLVVLNSKELLDTISSVPKHIVNLSRVILFDEFKADIV